MATDFEEGVLVGLLVGEGHFGGDGRQPQVTLRMHVRHEALFRWIERMFPGGRLYGPYEHGGRRYFQWMARGPFLRDELLPLLRRHLGPQLDSYAAGRLADMIDRYARQLRNSLAVAPLGSLPRPPAPTGDRGGAAPHHDAPATSHTGATADPSAIFRALRGERPPTADTPG